MVQSYPCLSFASMVLTGLVTNQSTNNEESPVQQIKRFVTSLVPLQLSTMVNEEKQVIWENPSPSSPWYCRPVRFEFEKETQASSQQEAQRMESQISTLTPSHVVVADKIVAVTHTLVLSMVDGKVAAALSSTHCQNCLICGAKPSQMNDLSRAEVEVDPMVLQFGLSPLHARIRFMEFVLGLGSKAHLRKSRCAKGDADSVGLKRKQIQEDFREDSGLLLDKPRSGGKGNSNDGNTARRFFQDHEKTAEITGVSGELIRRFAVILNVLNSKSPIKLDEFSCYAMETAKMYVAQYPFYYMSPTVHKVLLHGPAIIAGALLPIGQLSEEPAEARNKDFRRFRLSNSRKNSRINTNTDVIHMLLQSSDPVITALRRPERRQRTVHSAEEKLLLQNPGDSESDDSDNDSHSDSE